MKICDYVQSGDWKGEKHVPSIDAPTTVKAGEVFKEFSPAPARFNYPIYNADEAQRLLESLP